MSLSGCSVGAFERQAGELEAAGAALSAQRESFAQQAQELAVVRQQLADAAVRSDKASAAAEAAQLGLLQAQSRAEAAEQVAALTRGSLQETDHSVR